MKRINIITRILEKIETLRINSSKLNRQLPQYQYKQSTFLFFFRNRRARKMVGWGSKTTRNILCTNEAHHVALRLPGKHSSSGVLHIDFSLLVSLSLDSCIESVTSSRLAPGISFNFRAVLPLWQCVYFIRIYMYRLLCLQFVRQLCNKVLCNCISYFIESARMLYL